jgi:Fe-S cluster assembly protein SufD
MATQFASPLYQALLAAFDAAAGDLSEPPFLAAARQQARALFRQAGFPTTRAEDWKYTPLASFLREDYQLEAPGEPADLPPELLAEATIPGLDCYQVVLLNGRYLEAPGTPLPPSLAVRRLSEAFGDPAFLAGFGQQVDLARYPMAALNTALFQDGLLLQVADGSTLDKPLHLVHAYTGSHNQLRQPRHLVAIGRQASVSVVESVVAESGGARLLVNGVTEVALADNARLDHYLLQGARRGLLQVQHTEVRQQRDSVYSNYTFCLPGAELLRNNLHVDLAASNTESHLFGFYLAAEHQLVDNHTLMNHRMPHCESNEIYKGVLLDTATGVFNGKVLVQPGAQKTNAFQQNNNLLLSPRAVVYSKPQLEIFADDVKCSHGSTTGQLSPEALFYLRSRGIGEAAALAMLVQAFLFDVTDQVKLPRLKSHINALINHHLPVSQEMVKA